MDRRFVITSLALASTAAIVTRAVGQANSMSGNAMAGNSMAGNAMGGNSMSGDAMSSAMPMGDAEMKHAMDTQMVGALSLASSRSALDMASNADVKKFATFEVTEQETIADILASMKMPADQAQGALMVPSDDEVMAMLDADSKDKLNNLNGMSGDQFDTAYVDLQTDGHEKLLQIQEDYLKVGQNREQLDVAKLARATIKEHLQHLADLKDMMA